MPSQRSDLLICYGVNETKPSWFRTHQSISLIRNGNGNGHRAHHFFTSSKRVLLDGTVIHNIVSLIACSNSKHRKRILDSRSSTDLNNSNSTTKAQVDFEYLIYNSCFTYARSDIPRADSFTIRSNKHLL